VKNWMRILGILFIALAVLTPLVTTLVTFLLPETFASSTKILHPATNPIPLVTSVQTIVVRTNLDQVIRELNLTAAWGRKYKQPGDLSLEKCRELLTRMVRIENPRGSSIISIKVISDDKVEAATVANQLTAVYLRTSRGSVVIDRAKPNPKPARPNKKMNIVIGSFAGVTFLIVGIGLLISSQLAVKRP
jgi:capsular polysaccharide biosynthesis protein